MYFVLEWRVGLVALVLISHLHGFDGAEEENSINSNQPLRLNLTAIQQFPTHCATHCKDQIQYNSICLDGCGEWRRGLRDGCGLVCVGREGNFREFHACQVGCSKVIEDYYFYLSGVLGVPDPPTLISSSLQHTSLGLKWDGVQGGIPHLLFTVQKRFLPRTRNWETLLIDPFNTTYVQLEGLKPYTEYQFRIGWLIAADFPPLYSSESIRIVTLAKGLPNAPQITSIQPITNTSVSITWLPPTQPNGQLIAYILKLQNTPHGHLILKEIPIVGNQNQGGYTFSGLLPNTNYSLAISALNREGEGEPKLITFFTPQSHTSNDISKTGEPKLLIQGIRDVYVQAIDLLLQPEISVFVSTKNVTGMCAHFRKNFVFISTGDGEVIRRSLGPTNETKLILRKEKLDMDVSFLSVDWLHDQLYLVGQKKRSQTWSIRKSDLNGHKIQTVVSNLRAKPIDFQADPYTGYLYWVLGGEGGGSSRPAGLYKMDLYQREGHGEATPLLEEQGLGPFTIDFTSYRILVVHKTRNTVLSVSLDGEKADIRGNTHSPNWDDVVSIGNYGGVFYWTTGQSIVVEEYNAVQATFYHNSYEVARSHQPCSRLLLFHPSLQPTPAPMAPPPNVQAVYSQRKARVSWKPPPHIAGLGEGSWRSWNYEVTITPNLTLYQVNSTQLLIHDLQPNTQYSIQVTAYSETGRSPPSSTFRGQTLESSNLTFVWAGDSGRISSSDPLGDDIFPITFPSKADGILSLAASSSSIFFALQNGSAFEYDRGSGEVILLKSVSFAQSMAFDPIGQKLYWSNPNKQAIMRMTLGGNDTAHSPEFLPLLTTGLEIVLDSRKGLLVWTNGHSIEVARLNGRNQHTLHSNGLFSGIRILSLAIDCKEERIFWLSRNSSGSSLFQKSYENYDNNASLSAVKAELIGSYEDGVVRGPVRYFSNRLLLLQSGSEAMVQELSPPMSRSTIPIDPIANISTLFILDESLNQQQRIQPPSAVVPWSITVAGKWDSFTINWQPPTHTKQILFDISINGFNVQRTTLTWIRIENKRENASASFPHFDPYAEIEISITASTFWSSSKSTIVKRRTPPGKPSAPRNPRFYMKTLKYPYTNGSAAPALSGELRWDEPAEPNGVIEGYLVHRWNGGQKSSHSFHTVDLRKLSAEIRNVSSGIVHFAVQAYTVGGVGRLSRRIQVETDKGIPLPKLLLTAGDKVEILDVDRNGVERLRTPYNPYTVAYYALEDRLYCFDEGKHLFTSTLRGTNQSRILSLRQSVATNLVLNWISRKLYWISESSGRKERFWIERLDLDRVEDGPRRICSSPNPITALTPNPFTGALIWTSVGRSGIVTLMTSLDDGSSQRPFLVDTRNCNCSSIHSVGEGIAVDVDGIGRGRGILFTHPSSGFIWLADEHGCECVPLFNVSSTGIPLRLTSDSGHVYWISTQAHTHGLYAAEKMGSGLTELRIATGPLITQLSTLGPSVQPFPERECLIPLKLEVDEAILLNRSAHSLTLRLPAPEILNCSIDKVSIPSPAYSIYYARVEENGLTPCTKSSLSQCTVINNVSNPMEIQNVQPYTSYTLFLSVSTYYASREGLTPIFSSPVVMATAPGAPMPPTLLSLSPRTPTSITVTWAQPQKLNGRKIWYAVEWERVGSKGRRNQIWAAAEGRPSAQNESELSLNVTKLRPDRNYSVCVVAYSELGDEFSKSQARQITTLGPPSNLSLVLATPHQIIISWTAPNSSLIIKHEFVYREGWSSQWNESGIFQGTCAGCIYNFSVSGLRPKTMYGFRLKTWYAGDSSEYFYWPTDQQVEMETLADKPESPGVPIVRGIGNSRYEITWEKSEENGGKVELYSLEGRFKSLHGNSSHNLTEKLLFPKVSEVRRKREDKEVAQKFVAMETEGRELSSNWIALYNGTECRWEVVGVNTKSRIEFRVRSRNVYGWSEYSHLSPVLTLDDLHVLVSEPQSFGTVLGVVILGVFTLAAFGIIIGYVYRRQQKEKPFMEGSPTSAQRREVELATLRELPGGVHQNNILYAADLLLDFDPEGLQMQKVKRNQLTLLTHLGSGAFGDVYEGYAINIRPSHHSSSTLGARVAIKTLRKGASSKEKMQFVEEARLMGQFHHPHILELLGICLDGDPCLILELMSGGDLLSHLRSTRLPPTHFTSPHFTFDLIDLVEMALQVARGCVYLEQKHFVHRDLAARNCLVRISHSQQNPTQRIVKIGDFGLARDVYRNDYYRKEGEGLLPVRWMPPESLVDGVFTTQSDVWSFGVLLWEILTLGQQPYPARSNVEVLNYVRMGGRLQEPHNSSPALNWLMFRCWEFEPQNRPTFKESLQHLLRISEATNQTRTVPIHPAPPYQNTSPMVTESTDEPHPGDVDLEEEAESQVFTNYGPEDDFGQNKFYAREGPYTKYLEVVGNWTEPTSHPPTSHMEINDGYEIPLRRGGYGLPSPPPYPRRASHYSQTDCVREGRNLLASSSSEDCEARWRADPSSQEASTNGGEMTEESCSAYPSFNGMEWSRRAERAMD